MAGIWDLISGGAQKAQSLASGATLGALRDLKVTNPNSSWRPEVQDPWSGIKAGWHNEILPQEFSREITGHNKPSMAEQLLLELPLNVGYDPLLALGAAGKVGMLGTKGVEGAGLVSKLLKGTKAVELFGGAEKASEAARLAGASEDAIRLAGEGAKATKGQKLIAGLGRTIPRSYEGMLASPQEDENGVAGPDIVTGFKTGAVAGPPIGHAASKVLGPALGLAGSKLVPEGGKLAKYLEGRAVGKALSTGGADEGETAVANAIQNVTPDVPAPNLGNAAPDGVERNLSEAAKSRLGQMKPAEPVDGTAGFERMMQDIEQAANASPVGSPEIPWAQPNTRNPLVGGEMPIPDTASTNPPLGNISMTGGGGDLSGAAQSRLNRGGSGQLFDPYNGQQPPPPGPMPQAPPVGQGQGPMPGQMEMQFPPKTPSFSQGQLFDPSSMNTRGGLGVPAGPGEMPPQGVNRGGPLDQGPSIPPWLQGKQGEMQFPPQASQAAMPDPNMMGAAGRKIGETGADMGAPIDAYMRIPQIQDLLQNMGGLKNVGPTIEQLMSLGMSRIEALSVVTKHMMRGGSGRLV